MSFSRARTPSGDPPPNGERRPGLGTGSGVKVSAGSSDIHRVTRTPRPQWNPAWVAIRAAALAYAAIGWPVVLLEPRGKRPILPDWPNAASTDPDVIRGWFDRCPDANIGIVTGPRSGLAVLDLDPRSGGVESLTALESRVGVLPGTAMVVTGSDGVHFYYGHPGAHVTSRAHSLGRGLDVKADGGQVVAPPSIHPNGNTYRWCGDAAGLLDGDVSGFLAPWPTGQLMPAAREPNVVHLAPERTRRGGADAVLVGLVDVVLRAQSGDRNNALHWAACRAGEHIAAGRLGDEVAVDALLRAGRAAGLDEREIGATVRSGLRRALGGRAVTLTADVLVAEVRALHGQADRSPVPLATVDLAALARDGVPDPVRICDGLLYLAHLHQLIGAPEAGKSTVGAAWAVAVLRGGGRVVWLDEEAGPEQMVEKLLALGATPDLLAPDRLAYVPFPGRSWEAPDVAALDDLMTSIQPTLVVVDSSSAFMSAAGLNDSDNTDASRIYKTVYLRMAREHGAAVVVLDHLTKSDEGGRYARGAGSKLGLVDVSWRLDVVKPFDRANDGLLKLTIGKDRRGYLHRANEVRVTTGDGLAVTVTPVTAVTPDESGVKIPPAGRKLLDALRERREPSTITQLVDVVAARHGHGLKRETCSRALNHLVDESLVEVIGEVGREKLWALVEATAGAAA